MGTIYLALITTHLIQKYPIKVSIFAVLCYTGRKSENATQAENDARITKMYRGQENHPIRINATYEMNWANSFYPAALKGFGVLSSPERAGGRADKPR